MINDILKPGIILFIIAAIAAGLLGVVNSATEKPIEEQEIKTMNEAKNVVFPGEDLEFSEETEVPSENLSGLSSLAYSIGKDKKTGNTVGYAVKSAAKGYGGDISIMVGISQDGTVKGISILSHSETPGLGANADNDSFKNQYKDKKAPFEVVKSGASGSNSDATYIDAITSATITSKAVTTAVNGAVEYCMSELIKEGA